MLRTQFLEKLQGLVPESNTQKYVIGLSGGIDSVVLFDLLTKTFPVEQLVVAHFNHLTRGEESHADEIFVREICARARIRCLVGRREGSGLSEASLRNERLQFLKRVCRETQSDYILLAHHQQDQLETFLMRLMRGTGLKGLSGIRARNGKLIRPLLWSSKTEIEKYAKQQELAYINDSSNLSARYFRNRIRHELLPTFLQLTESHGGASKFYNRFSEMTDSLAKVSDRAEGRGRRDFKRLAVKTDFFIRVNKKALLNLNSEQRVHLIREIFWQLKLETPGRIWSGRVLSFLERDLGTLSIPKGRCVISCGETYFQNLEMKKLPPPQPIQRGKEWQCAELGLSFKLPAEFTHLQLRFFIPGDRIGNTKLKKWFLEQRVPLPERGLIPILAEKESSKVFWVYPQKHLSIDCPPLKFPFLIH